MNDRIIPAVREATVGAITFRVIVEGKELPQTYEFLSLDVYKEINRVPFARLVLRDGDAAEEDFVISNTDTLIPGKKVEVQVGYDAEDQTVFKGILIKHSIKIAASGVSTLRLECRDESVKMTIGRKNKYFTEVSDSEAIETIVGTYGLDKSVESTSLKHQQLVQHYCTDWDFVLSRAQMNGQLVIVEDGKLTTAKPDFGQSPKLNLQYGSVLYEFEAEMDARYQYGAVECSAWDTANQTLLQEEVSSSTNNQQGNITESDLAKVIGLSKLEYRHSGKLESAELKAWAEAQHTWSQLGKIVGRAKVDGTYDVKVGEVVQVSGVGDRFNGKAIVTALRQELAFGEWYTHIQFGKPVEWFYEEAKSIVSPPASGLLPGLNGLQIGVVKQLEGDPAGEERILIYLPIIDPNGEGTWARLASLDAGENRGWVFRPEIDDEVIVGFVNDDPRDAVVLGMLHSSAKPAPIAATDDNFERGLVTKSEIKIHIDDDKKIVTLETPCGNKLILDDDTGGVFMEDQNGNKCSMDSSGISLESAADIILKATGDVKIEGVNIEEKAQAQHKAESGAGSEIKSSAIMTIKGSLVQIN
ncbi:MAG: type VI secretion system tip protein VgrG [Bacteroidota bacterium]